MADQTIYRVEGDPEKLALLMAYVLEDKPGVDEYAAQLGFTPPEGATSDVWLVSHIDNPDEMWLAWGDDSDESPNRVG
ncbi:hypothetical protein [Longispora albida]|uniref:hypothetical protein n=1 Tax=Longispora albida TaxID=203523 RepID=UPI0003633AA5|nr:hypothetical protein [Longispora albida]